MHACTELGSYVLCSMRVRVSESQPLRLRPEPVQGTLQHAQMSLRRSQRLGQSGQCECDTARYDRLGYWLRLGFVEYMQVPDQSSLCLLCTGRYRRWMASFYFPFLVLYDFLTPFGSLAEY